MADIFEIVGRLSIDGVDKAEKELNNFTDSGERTSSKLSKLGSVAGAVGKSVLAIGSAVTAGSVALVKGVQSSYGELQQNLGGSEAVFGQYAKNVQKIGEEAYKNMGMSQSQFLATANKMGSLLQGSGISQQESLDMTTKAMQRASDVASVMGIDMEMAMESIAGACKGNFTMMDNLGVAMNATTLEAYAHSKGIEDFTWKTATQAEKNSLAMQMFLERTEQYAGNFARESTDTITGAMGNLGSAWKDFMAGLGNPEADMARLTNNLAQSFGGMIKNIVPIVENIADSLPIVMDVLIKAISDLAPSLIETFTQLITKVIDALVQLLPQFIPLAVDCIMTVVDALVKNLPLIIEAGVLLIQSLLSGLADATPILVPAIIDAVVLMFETLINNIDLLIDGGIQLTLGITQGLIEALPMLLDKIPIIINQLVTAITANLPKILAMGVELIVKLGSGLIVALPNLLAQVPLIISAIVGGLYKGVVQVASVGRDLVRGLWEGISGMGGWIASQIQSFASNVISSFKSFFQINSPSRVMMGIGGFITQGLGVGIDEDDSAEKSIKGKVDDIVDIANGSLSNIKVGTSVDNLISESPMQKYQLDFNAQIGALNDGFDNLLALIGQYLPNIASNVNREIVLNGDSLAVGMSRRIDSELGTIAVSKMRGNV